MTDTITQDRAKALAQYLLSNLRNPWLTVIRIGGTALLLWFLMSQLAAYAGLVAVIYFLFMTGITSAASVYMEGLVRRHRPQLLLTVVKDRTSLTTQTFTFQE